MMARMRLTTTDPNFPASNVTHRDITEDEAKAIITMLNLGASAAVLRALMDATIMGMGGIAYNATGDREYRPIRPETMRLTIPWEQK